MFELLVGCIFVMSDLLIYYVLKKELNGFKKSKINITKFDNIYLIPSQLYKVIF